VEEVIFKEPVAETRAPRAIEKSSPISKKVLSSKIIVQRNEQSSTDAYKYIRVGKEIVPPRKCTILEYILRMSKEMAAEKP
jgi:hypothetical protein